MSARQSPKKQIYLDYAAATPVDERVFEVMKPFYMDQFFNPSSLYLESKRVFRQIEDSRNSIARLIGARPTEVIFTSGATESNNLAIHGVMQEFSDSKLLISDVEHPAVTVPSEKYKKETVKVNKKGFVDLTDLKQKINDEVVLVSVIYANNEIGVIQPIKKIAGVIDQVRLDRQSRGVELPIYLHSDASQVTNYKKIDVNRMKTDLLTISSAKIYGPKGTGLLYINKDVKLIPQITGGGQEFSVRSGTENTASIVGFSKAFEITQSSFKAETIRAAELRDYFAKALQNQYKEKVVFNTVIKNCLPNFLNVSFLGQDGERLVMELDEAGIMTSTGSACSAGSGESSVTLKAIGSSEDVASSSVRFSLGRYTSKQDIDYVLSVLTSII